MKTMFVRTALCAALIACAPAALAVPATGSGAAPVQSRDGYDRHVVIKNRTGWTMVRFYASDSRADSWEEDILGRRVLGNGEDIRINIDDGSGACLYDFKAEFTNGQELTRFNVNVCQVSEYTYTR